MSGQAEWMREVFRRAQGMQNALDEVGAGRPKVIILSEVAFEDLLQTNERLQKAIDKHNDECRSCPVIEP